MQTVIDLTKYVNRRVVSTSAKMFTSRLFAVQMNHMRHPDIVIISWFWILRTLFFGL